MTDQDDETWWLAAQVPPINSTSAITLDFLRKIGGRELQQVQEANALLTRLATAAPYAKLFDLFNQLQQATKREGNKSAERVAIDMNQAARALSRVAESFPDELRQQIVQDFGDESEELRQLDVAIAEECSKPAFRIMTKITHLNHGPFEPNKNNIIIGSASLEALVEAGLEIPANINLVATLYHGVIVAERLIGRQLRIYDSKIKTASLLLRQIAAEVPDGAPGIIRADQIDRPGKAASGIGPMTPVPLAIDSAVQLHRAIRMTNDLLARTNGNSSPITEKITPASGMPASTAHTPQDGSARIPGKQSQEEEPIPQPSPQGHRETADQIADLRALAAHTTNLADSLERVWSDSLSPDALGEAHAEMDARVTSLLTSIKRQVSQTEQAVRETGVDTVLGSFPPSLQEIGQLSFTPNTQQQWRQAQMAQLDALALLLQALNAMRSPSARRITFPTGIEETWWEAGAFSMLRERARLLVQISEQTALAAAALTGEHIANKTGPRLSLDTLVLAGEALSHGNMISAVTLARRAIIQRAKLDSDSIPNGFMKRLAEDPRLASEAPVLHLIEEVARKEFASEDLDISVTVLLAPHAIRIAHKLCFQGTDSIRRALGVDDANSDGEQSFAPAVRPDESTSSGDGITPENV